ncbi:hypothetical protein [Paenibacillus apiarius]|uniref:hypothetical protein n=1 Tax=Paenibacillus apiarius TaxID=46240 RepID=UPI001980EEB8|nr:hypothetical protein [Paenibacillus apiarius]MBN3523608.1 hypothetical protein [Paenibacillus apiarius]
MIGWLILACEIGFWVFILLGLFARYRLRQRTLGTVLLLCTPLIDILLIVFTVVDLRNGAAATAFHGLAAVYVGVSIAFGKRMIQWADERFAHLFAGGSRPLSSSVKHGAQHAKQERAGWYRHVLAWAIGSLLLFGIIYSVGNANQTESLLKTAQMWTAILIIDFIWSFSYTLWPRKS